MKTWQYRVIAEQLAKNKTMDQALDHLDDMKADIPGLEDDYEDVVFESDETFEEE